MLSDTLYECDKALRDHQVNDPWLYGPHKDEIDAIRCKIVVLQMKLDAMVPVEWLDDNPIMVAARAGDIKPHDDFMAGDDSVLADFRVIMAARMAGAVPE